MWKKCMTWRKRFKAEDITPQSVSNELKSGKAFYHGVDKQNHPCLVLRTRFHFPNKTTNEETFRFGIWLIEMGIKLSNKHKSSQIVIIYDRKDFSYWNNFDRKLISLFSSFIKIVQELYAEVMFRFYVLDVNWLFRTMWKVISPLLNSNVRKKIVILGDRKELLKFFRRDQLIID